MKAFRLSPIALFLLGSLPLSGYTCPGTYDKACDSGDSASCNSEDTAASESSTATDVDKDGYLASEDCDDSNASVHPGADEICDGIDNDCDDVGERALACFTQEGDDCVLAEYVCSNVDASLGAIGAPLKCPGDEVPWSDCKTHVDVILPILFGYDGVGR